MNKSEEVIQALCEHVWENRYTYNVRNDCEMWAVCINCGLAKFKSYINNPVDYKGALMKLLKDGKSIEQEESEESAEDTGSTASFMRTYLDKSSRLGKIKM